MNLYLSNNSGILEIVTGSMFSGKSEELIRRVRRAKYAKQKTVVFKHAIDKRFEDDDVNIISHGKDRIEAILASNTKEMDNYLEENPGIKVVGVDEAQFFGEEVVAFCEKYVKNPGILPGINCAVFYSPSQLCNIVRDSGILLCRPIAVP